MHAEATPGRGLSFLLNGHPVDIAVPSNRTTLLEFLRSRGLTGAKEGCAEGECGACAVLVVDAQDGMSVLRAINSCLALLPTIDGHEVFTVESIAESGELGDAQRALAEAGGSQCGYCTPGFVMSLVAEQYRPGRSGPCDPLALSGNLCRCTGYRPIADAALSVGPPPAGSLRNRLEHPAPQPVSVRLPSFSRPTSLQSAFEILRDIPDATPIAGGTDLAVDNNLRGRCPAHLLSLSGIDELQDFSHTAVAITIGAALPLTELGRRWRDAPPVIHEWLELFASPLIRNRATLGGNLATASPIGDAAPLLLALDASIQIGGRDGTRTVPLSAFFLSYRKTALGPGEIIVAATIPKPLPSLVRFYKASKRRLDDISTVAAAMALDTHAGRIVRARMAFGGVAATPVRVSKAEESLVHERWDERSVARVRHVLETTLTPMSDHRGSKEYRLAVASSLVEKFLWETRQ
jgi:xanthine dehydrogenase small subunit